MRAEFRVLGEPEALVDGRAVEIGHPRQRALLVALLLAANRPVPYDELVDQVWGVRLPRRPRNTLYGYVSRLRSALAVAPGVVLERQSGGYLLRLDPDCVDVHRFRNLVVRAGRTDDDAVALELLDQALRLWRGPLAGPDTPWLGGLRDRLHGEWTAARLDRADRGLRLGRHAELLADLGSVAAASPWDERVAGQFMLALYRSGRQVDALEHYQRFRTRLVDEVAVEPGADLRRLHQRILTADPTLSVAVPGPVSAGDVSDRAADPTLSIVVPDSVSAGDVSDRAADSTLAGVAAGPVPAGDVPVRADPAFRAEPRRGLPAPLTSLVGRADELARIGLLLSRGRLVTLTGPGGTGKTRLAVEAASREPGDACLVDLAPVPPADVPQAVAGALGLRDATLPTAAGRTAAGPVERLVAALAEHRLLLLLDNCEHVLDVAAGLAHRLLTECPGLRVLATSREPLGITGEALCPVPPLAAPPPEAEVGAIADYPAVRLFTDRAGAVAPDFTLDAANAATVSRICRTLDGLPLAIELAAARIRALPVAELAARLDDRFAVLSRGSRTAVPRHRTLRAAVAWSWDLLDPAERRLASRLSVFSGGFGPEAARQVCAAGAGAEAVEDLLAGLADRSLVERVTGDDLRYRMLETIRVFCADQLDGPTQRRQLRVAHANYFLDLTRAVEPRLLRDTQLEALRRLDAERDNLHAALRSAIRDDPRIALPLFAALLPYWWLRGGRHTCEVLAAELLAGLTAGPPEGLTQEYALCLLVDAAKQPDSVVAAARVAAAGAIVAGLDRQPRHPFLGMLWGRAAVPGQPLPAPAGPPVELDPWSRALEQWGIGHGLLFGGDADAAEQAFHRALRGFRALGERWGTALALSALGTVAERRGGYATAVACTAEAVELADQLDCPADLATLLCQHAGHSLLAADPATARFDYLRASELARAAGAPEILAEARVGLGELAQLDGDLPGARRLFEGVLTEELTAWRRPGIRSRACLGLGRLAEAAQDVDTARGWYRDALAAAHPTDRRLVGAATDRLRTLARDDSADD
ncbi:AfsR/SARP family transcriptional regulator [Plantactinospora endophytica]|uniref:SARP family transcriptional regulator n=1 Tax=Plantactinospora endophytica TaxID=673535 RepID=A0ABQ4E918_9ACTN|nr:BTAD domain-containing putative transcriptional regulator [Plantactinospora endophytica]GIG91208.1 SARP family transcriptional regulator [Plantactinospora endophytica]